MFFAVAGFASSTVALGLGLANYAVSKEIENELKKLDQELRQLQDSYYKVGLDLKGVVNFFTDASHIIDDI